MNRPQAFPSRANGASPGLPLVFGLDDPHSMAGVIAACCDAEAGALEIRDFSDSEFKIRPLTDPYARQVWVVAGLFGDARRSPQDRLCMLLCLVSALRDHGARSVTVVAPYLPFARKDRRTQAFDPISIRYVAQWLEASGADALITLEPHNFAAFDNAFRIPARAASAHRVLLAAALEAAGDTELVLASPDPGASSGHSSGVRRSSRVPTVLRALPCSTSVVGQARWRRIRRMWRGSQRHGAAGG